MTHHHPLKLLAICFVLSFVFATMWVVVMTWTLPSTDGAYGMAPFGNPLVFPVMSIFASIVAIIVYPFTYVALRDRALPRALTILTAIVIAEILLVTPFNAFLGLLGSFVDYGIGLAKAHSLSPARSSHVERFQFSLRSLLVGVSVFAMFLGVMIFLKSFQQPYKLIEAAYQGDLVMVEHLLSSGADVHARDGWNSSAIMYAASGGHFEILKRLLAAGAHVDERSRMHLTPLMWAARNGHLLNVKYLLEKGADVSAVDRDGKTAIDLARDQGRTEIVNFLDHVATIEKDKGSGVVDPSRKGSRNISLWPKIVASSFTLSSEYLSPRREGASVDKHQKIPT